MSSIKDILFLISKKFSIYISLSILIGGVISNILNIAIFTQLTVFRHHQSTFYFISESIVDCIQILITFTSRINLYAFNYDPSLTSTLWCKMRPTIAQTCAIISTETICFASIDQYLSTSYHVRLRQMSTLKLAHHLTFFLVCLALLHALPWAIFFQINPIIGCVSSNSIFTAYISFFHYCVLIGLLPITISCTFAALAYLNVRHIIRHQVPNFRRRLDRQLTAMVLIRVCLLTITTLPFIAYKIYELNVPFNPNNILKIAVDQLIGAVSYSIYFLNYSVFELFFFNCFCFILFLEFFLRVSNFIDKISSTSKIFSI